MIRNTSIREAVSDLIAELLEKHEGREADAIDEVYEKFNCCKETERPLLKTVYSELVAMEENRIGYKRRRGLK